MDSASPIAQIFEHLTHRCHTPLIYSKQNICAAKAHKIFSLWIHSKSTFRQHGYSILLESLCRIRIKSLVDLPKKRKRTMLQFKLWIERVIRKIQRFFAAEEILVIGDSHASVFRHWRFIANYPRKSFCVSPVYGATVSGLENPNSKTQAYQAFREFINAFLPRKIIILMGEVDTGFVIWYRAQKYNEDISRMLEKAVQGYEKFLSELLNKIESVIVISTPLPTIANGESLGKVANLRKEIVATQQERTDLTLHFNHCIKDYCQMRGIQFIDLDNDCLGPNGLVKEELRNKEASDHHYDRALYARLLCRKLKNAI